MYICACAFTGHIQTCAKVCCPPEIPESSGGGCRRVKRTPTQTVAFGSIKRGGVYRGLGFRV